MRQNVRNSRSRTKGLLGRLAVEKKKTVTASCLIGVMAFMWVRVLTKKTPEAAEAAFVTTGLNVEGRPNPESKISFIGLPKVAGRNDVITRDFFTANGWRHFVGRQGRNSVGTEASIVLRNGSEEVIRKVAEKLKLEAIVLSRNPRAVINDNVVSVGDKVLIGDGVDTYECEVVKIKENMVVIKCREAEITLKFTQVSMTDN